jgi:hypothetical protein
MYNVELHNVYSSPNIIRVIKSRKMGRNVAYKRNEDCIENFGQKT